MTMMVEVYNLELKVPMILNMESVFTILPFKKDTKTYPEMLSDGSAIFTREGADFNPLKPTYKVRESFESFKQFVVQTVSSDDIAARIKNLPKVAIEEYPRVIPEVQKPKEIPQHIKDLYSKPPQRGRPKKTVETPPTE